MTDLWIRNPDRAMSILAQEGVSRITWTRQHIQRLKFDGIAYTRQFYMHSGIRPKIMLIGIQGSSEYTLFSKLEEPIAVYPTWSGKNDEISELIRLIEKPWGEDRVKCSDLSVPSSLRPVFGQKHRVILHNCPSAGSGAGQQFWLTMSRIQEDYPEVDLFVNGPSSFSVLFGLDFRTADFGLCDAGDINQVLILPSGVMIKLNKQSDLPRLLQWEDWIKSTGFTVDEILKDQAKRFAFRIRSVRWAASHWSDNFRFHSKMNNAAPDFDSSDADYVPRSSRSIILRRKKFTTRQADKILCNRCRIAPGCKVFRADSICGLKGTTVSDLEKYFQSRDAGKIIDGLAHLTRLQARRLESAIDAEAQSDDIDPEVTKMMNGLFKNGSVLAKLVNPQLAGPGTRVQVNVGVNAGNAERVSNSNPKEIISGVVAALEAQGIERSKITPDMVAGVLKSMAVNDERTAVEAQVIAGESVTVQTSAQAQPALPEKTTEDYASELFGLDRVIDSTFTSEREPA